GLHLPAVAGLETVLTILGMEIGTRAFFNPMGWQLVFVIGVVLGAHMRRGDLARTLRLHPRQTDILSAALVILALTAIWRLSLTFGWMSDDVVSRLFQFERRAELGLLTLIDFAALAYTTAWLLVAGQQAASAGVR